MDSDTTTRIGDHARILAAFETSGDVLVGTQMVAKGLDYPTVTLAAVVAADLGLNLPDFRAGERSFALIAQVCGRSGRGRRGEAIVQTYSPEHPAIAFAAHHDYDGFAALELRERADLGFPPARRLIYVGVIGRDRARVISAAARYAEILREAESRRSAWTGAISGRASERGMALPDRAEDREAKTVAGVYSGTTSSCSSRRFEDSPRDQRGSLKAATSWLCVDFFTVLAGATAARFIALAKRDFFRAALFG